MAWWFYQIKGMAVGEEADTWSTRWSWPPLFSGRVEADTSKAARAMVESEYGTKLPGRVSKDDKATPFLCHIEVLTLRRAALFDEKTCSECGAVFRVIDHYNNLHEPYKGDEYCSWSCKQSAERTKMAASGDDIYGRRATPCIYRITNKHNGMVYIGQTRQAVTLRWWQHIKWGADDCKFHTALRESDITDWTFDVVEVVADAAHLDAREAHHIALHDAVARGYNSVKVAAREAGVRAMEVGA